MSLVQLVDINFQGMNLQIHSLGQLFEEVQLQNILGDGKTFPDCIPNILKMKLPTRSSVSNAEKSPAPFSVKYGMVTSATNFSANKETCSPTITTVADYTEMITMRFL